MQYFFDTLLNQQITYGYGDGFNRVTQRTVTSGTVQNYTYAYDRYGNRVSQTALQTGYNFNPLINAVNNHITTSGYLYDAAGNMTNDSVHAYSYDAEGNITKVDGGSTAQYVYDVFNHRIPTLCNNDPESDLPACPVGPPPGTTSGCVSSGTQGCIMNPNPPLNPGGGGGGGPTATTGSSTATAAPSNPHCSKAGLLPSSVGFSYGGTADIGGGPNAGSAGTAGAGAGYFYDSNASSFGAFAGGGAAGYAGPAYAGLPSQQGQPFAFGAYAGAGPSVWFSNAHTAQQLAGPFTTYSLNAGGGPFKGLSIQLSTGGGIWQLSIGLPIPFSGLSTPALAFDELTTTTTATHAGCVQ